MMVQSPQTRHSETVKSERQSLVHESGARAAIEPIEESSKKTKADLSSPKSKLPKSLEENQASITAGSLNDIERLWPQVIENIKGTRRLTWSLLTTGVTLEKFENGVLSILFANAGAAESFARSESEEILKNALANVIVGVQQITVTVGETSLFPKLASEVVDEEESEDALTGENLLMRELGATVISKDDL